ncbi:MAG: hypothetical protein LBK95_11475 [Bifidobacteriaceae bacterium]|jgi:hypothetical protein|nr:hypothetical protein [Bifidobacteriaceae bacterium]
MIDWIGLAYSAPDEYPRGCVPTTALLPEIVITLDTSARHWTWEARVAVRELRGALIEPLGVVLGDEQYKRFAAWVRVQKQYSYAERQEVIRTVRALRIDPEDKAHGMFLNSLLATDPRYFGGQQEVLGR